MSRNQSTPRNDSVFDTDVLRYLISIVDEQSLTRAAEKLYLSQPALSRYLRKTEEALGAPIFIREHNQLHLTETGIIFINAARSIVGIEDMCTHQLQLKSSAVSSTDREITLMVQDIFFSAISESILPQWRKIYPEVRLTITCGTGDQVRTAIPSAKADLYLLFGSSQGNGLYDSIVLGNIPMMIYRPNANVSNSVQRCSNMDFNTHCHSPLSALPQAPPLLLCSHDSYLRSLQEHILREAEIYEPQVVAEAELTILIDLLPLGYGCTLLPEFALRTLSAENSHWPDDMFVCECLLAWQKSAQLTPLLENLITIIQEYIENLL